MNINRAEILGRVTKNPEVRSTISGKKVATFGIATNNTYKNQYGEKVEETDFHNIVAFGRLAEIVEQYVTRGQLLYVSGRIKTSSYEGKDGVKRYKTDILITEMQMGPRSQKNQENQNQETEKYPTPEDELGGTQTTQDENDIKNIPY